MYSIPSGDFSTLLMAFQCIQVTKYILYENVGSVGFEGNSGVKHKETRV